MKRRHLFLGLGAAALLFGAYLSFRADEGSGNTAVKAPNFPRESNRAQRRRQLEQQRMRAAASGDLPAPAGPLAPAPPPPPARKVDPLHAALKPGSAVSAVFEANALRNSDFVQRILDCWGSHFYEQMNALGQELGLNPLQDLDRLAVSDDVMAFSGRFGSVDWAKLTAAVAGSLDQAPASRAPYGNQGEIFRFAKASCARWSDQMLLCSDQEQALKDAIDRIEERSPFTPTLSSDDAYGEGYGVVSAAGLAELFPGQAELLKSAKEAVFHLDVRQDAAATVEISGDNAAKLSDLAKVIGGGLSLARAQAFQDGRKDEAELLDFARVTRGGDGSLVLNVAVPSTALPDLLGDCGADKVETEKAPAESR